MTTPKTHEFIFNLDILRHNNGRGFFSLAHEAENVTWRCGVMGTEEDMLLCQLMCNAEDRSNFWSIDIDYQASILHNGQRHCIQNGMFHHAGRQYLTVRFPLEFCKECGLIDKKLKVQFIVTIVNKVGVRKERIHDFTIPQKHLTNMVLVVEDKKLYVSKQILAMQSEVLMNLLFPDGKKDVEELKFPDDYNYDKVVALMKVFYGDSDALTVNTINDVLDYATRLCSETARQKCERWLSKTGTLDNIQKMRLAQKYSLVELQDECMAMLKTSHQVQKLFENPKHFTDSEIVELMGKVTLSIVGHTYEYPK